jgi:hypothetical protein
VVLVAQFGAFTAASVRTPTNTFPKPKDLMQSLDELSQDRRLARVFSPNSSDACDLCLWLLEIKKAETREYRLLYGWVIPRILRELNTWSISNSLPEWKSPPYAYRAYRLNFHHCGKVIFNLATKLCEGFSLQGACQEIGVVEPLKSANQPHPCGQFHLATSQRELTRSFIVRPVIFVEPAWSHLAVIDELKPITSPNEVVPAFVGSLCRLGKLNLFRAADGTPFPQHENLAKKCLSHLQAETGLAFCGADSKRLGNLEWLSFPAADSYEKNQVKVSFDSPAYTATIEIPPNVLAISTQATVRCRLWNDREVSLDCLKTLQVTELGASVSFTTQQEITKYLVTIWVQPEHGDVEEIWYEISAPIFRQVNLNQGINGFEGQLESNWLREYSKAKKLSKPIKQAQTVRQTHYQQLSLVNYQPVPWIVEGQQIYQFAKRCFSRPSGGLFIRNGWGANMEEPGIFTFFKWLQSLTDDASISKVLIVDPYFDESGITEVIARARAAQAEYVVLANTQTNSQYPTDPSQPREPHRATRLKGACYRGDINLLLSGLKFRLLDLRSTTEKNDQLFHDRYILLFDNQGKAKTGYHLSNSIQGATKHHPLLITPIPSDVLSTVEAYVQELLNPSSDSNSRIIPLFSSIREPRTLSAARSSFKLSDIPHVNFFFATLLQDESLLCLDETALGDHLKSYGDLDEEKGNFEFREEDSTQADFYLGQLASALIAASPPDFIKLWTGLWSWLNHTSNSSDYLDRLISSSGEALSLRLKDFLVEAPDQLNLPIASFKPDTHAEALLLTDLLNVGFPEAVQKSNELLRFADCRTWVPCLQDNGIRYAAQVLAQLDPGTLVSVITELQQALAAIPENETDASKLWNLRHTLAFILKQVFDDLLMAQFGYRKNPPFLSALLGSDIPLIRAITANSFSPLWNSRTKPLEAFTAIAVLTPLEQTYTLAEWGFNLRVRANPKRYLEEDEALGQLLVKIFNQMHQVFPTNISNAELSEIVCRLSGPSEGDWAVSTTNDFLIPLINNGKLSDEQVAELWLPILFKQLEAHTSSPNRQQEDETFEPDLEGLKGLELIQLGAWAIVNNNAENRRKWLERLKNLQGKTHSILRQPFLRYRHYQTWHKASICLLWLVSLANILVQTYEVNIAEGEYRETEFIAKCLEQIDETLAATREENPLPNKKCLWEFVANFKQK